MVPLPSQCLAAKREQQAAWQGRGKRNKDQKYLLIKDSSSVSIRSVDYLSCLLVDKKNIRKKWFILTLRKENSLIRNEIP